MSALFSKPKTPDVPPPPPAPVASTSEVQEAGQREILRRRGVGRAANVLSSREETSSTQVSAARLLGQ